MIYLELIYIKNNMKLLSYTFGDLAPEEYQ